jgi:hypothetical protein
MPSFIELFLRSELKIIEMLWSPKKLKDKNEKMALDQI